eukprot:11224754-Lingulodinium_polyedra.AAC.1
MAGMSAQPGPRWCSTRPATSPPQTRRPQTRRCRPRCAASRARGCAGQFPHYETRDLQTNLGTGDDTPYLFVDLRDRLRCCGRLHTLLAARKNRTKL